MNHKNYLGRNSFWSLFAITLVILGVIGTFASRPVQAATFFVNSFGDTTDVNPGDGLCVDSGGACTLRAAIMEANALAGTDTINIPAGTVNMSLTTGTAGDSFGDLDIFDNTNIVGAGITATTIDANSISRAIQIGSGATVNIERLEIREGNTPGSTGGGINIGAGATVLIDRVLFDNNSAPTAGQGRGGGLHTAGSNVTIRDSIFTNNSTYTGGGAISALAGANLTIEDTTFDGNSSSPGAGSGVYAQASLATVVNIKRSTFQNHVNAAVFNNGADVTIENSTFTGNTATNFGTVNSANGNTSVNNSTFSGNNNSGGADSLRRSGGTLTVSNSIISGNSATNCSGVTDGGNNISWPAGNNCPGTQADPLLGALTGAGSTTDYFPIDITSPAWNAGANASCSTEDQTGTARPQSTTCDAGSFELVSPAFNITIVNDILPSSNVALINGVYYPTASGAQLSVADIESALITGDLKIDTHDGGGGENGDVTWNADGFLDYNGTGTRSLEVKAAGDIRFGSRIEDLSAGGDQLNVAFNANQNENDGYVRLNQASVIDTNGGTFTATGTGAPTGSVSGLFAETSGVIITQNSLVIANGGVLINGTGGSSPAGAAGVLIADGGNISSSGSINITGVSGAGDGSPGDSNHGIYITGLNSSIAQIGGMELNLTGSSTSSATTDNGIHINNNAKIGGGANTTITLEGDAIQSAGVLFDSGDAILQGSDLIIIGTGGGPGNGVVIRGANSSINLDDSGAIFGSITMTGTVSTPDSAGSVQSGIVIENAGTQISSESGNITLNGTGSDNINSANDGIRISGGAIVDTTVAGTINLNGNGGAGNTFNNGVRVEGAGSKVESAGDININGTGGSNGSGANNTGILIANSGLVSLTGSGNTATLTGTGAQGTSFNDGITVSNGGSITSVDGNIILDGTIGGIATGSNNHAIQVFNGSVTAGGTGSLTLIGNSGLGTPHSGFFNHNVYVAGSTLSTNSGLFTITTDSGSNSINEEGLFLDITGNLASTSGDIDLNVNTLSLATGSTISGAGELFLKPLNASANLVFTADDVAAFQNGFSQITIGRADGTGDISLLADVLSTATINDPLLIQSPAVGTANIDISGVTLDLPAGAGGVTLNSGGSVNFNTINAFGQAVDVNANNGPITGGQIVTFNISGTGGTVTMTAPAGDINMAGAITTFSNSGAGGPVTLVSNGNVTFDGFTTVGGNDYSIYTAGSTPGSGGEINITHGGDGITPFIVGNPTTNGTFEAISSGDATIATTQSFLGLHTESGPADINIITTITTQSGPIFTVTNASDTNGLCEPANCSLREAIAAANSIPNGATPDEIHFAIPGAGPHLIQPPVQLPVITEAVVIDGYTQTGASKNNLTTGNDAVILIEINSGAPVTSDTTTTLEFQNGTSSGSSIQGLSLTGSVDAAAIKFRVAMII